MKKKKPIRTRKKKTFVAALPEGTDPVGVKLSLASLSLYEQLLLDHTLGFTGTQVEDFTVVVARGESAAKLRRFLQPKGPG